MFLMSSKNFSLWYTIFKKKENYSLNMTKLRYIKQNKKPVLPTKFFMSISKKNLRSFKLDSFFNWNRKQKLLFVNLSGFKKFYRDRFKFKTVDYRLLNFKRTNINSININKVHIWKSNILNTSIFFKPINIKQNSLYIYIYLKRVKRINRKLFFTKRYLSKNFFFQRFKFKYGLKRKKNLKKIFLCYFRKFRYYSKLKFKKYSIYNFHNRKYNIRKKYRKIIFRFKKKTFLNKRSNLILPKLISFNLKMVINFPKNEKYKFHNTLFTYLNYNNVLKNILNVNLKSLKVGSLFFIQNKYRYNIQQKNILFKTKHVSSFIIKNIGLIFPMKLVYRYSSFELYRLRKKVYSFLRKNEYKAHIFNSRKKQILWRNFFYNKKSFMVNSVNFSYEFFRQEFYLEAKFFKNNFNITNFVSDSIFFKNNIFYKDNKNRNNFFDEIRVSRVRFKPGYQRLWRDFRKALAELINFKCLYQKQLTNYLTRFYRKIQKSYISQDENSIDKILLYSKLLPDKSSLNLFFNNNMIFLNTKRVESLLIYVYKNDFIQIEISNWYYIFSRWLSKMSKNRNLKFKRLVFKKGMSSRYKLMKQKKQRSIYTPNWILNSKYDFQDVKSFLEIDFMTLSFFVIYDYNYYYYYTPMDFKLVNYNIYKMYNWKYLT